MSAVADLPPSSPDSADDHADAPDRGSDPAFDHASDPASDRAPGRAPGRAPAPAPAPAPDPATSREARALSAVVTGEARRAASAERIEPDPARIAAGWERRFVADGPRTEEMMQLYRALGYEVVADPIAPDQMLGDCADCRLLVLLSFRMLYTRRPPA